MNAEVKFLTMVREGVDPDALEPWLAKHTFLFEEHSPKFLQPLRDLKLEAGRCYARFDEGAIVLEPRLRPPVVSPVNLRLYTAVLLLADAPTCGDFGLDCGLFASLGSRVVCFGHQASRPLRLTAREVIRGLPMHDDVAWKFSLRLTEHLLADAITVPALEQAEAILKTTAYLESSQKDWVGVLESLAPQPVRASPVYGRLIEFLSRPSPD